MSTPHRQQLMKPTKTKFRDLIDSLRNRTLLKEHISLPIQSKKSIQIQHNDIFPVTQTVLPIAKNVVPLKEIFRMSQKQQGEGVRLSEIEESISETEVDTGREGKAEEMLFSQITDLLRPEERLAVPKNEGRTGCIRHQRFNLNKSNRQNLPKYTKVPQPHPLNPSLDLSIPQNTCIKDLDQIDMIKYWNNTAKLDQGSSIEKAQQIFCKLIEELNIDVTSPTIKRYKNCIYFGSEPSAAYQGIIYYFDSKLYYGELSNGRKHGYGVQIDFARGIRYAGNFQYGKKNGVFMVQKERENYEGFLLHGLYHGNGQLMTEDCIYLGGFQNGKKHGFGEELYTKTGLRLRGCFKNGKFQHLDKSKTLYDPTSEPHLNNKLQKILTKRNSYDIDFQFQRNFNRQIEGSIRPREGPLTHEDSKSLFDIMINTPKTNKYDFNFQVPVGKLPNLRIEGIQAKLGDNPEAEEERGIRKEVKQPFDKRYHSQQHRSMAASRANALDLDEPLRRHRLNTPIHRLK